MNTTAVLCGVLGVVCYFFYYIIGVSSKGDDGQGVNKPELNAVTDPQPSADAQKGRWD